MPRKPRRVSRVDAPRCDKVIQFALLEAGRQDELADRELGPIHLLKYVYLADLAHAERAGGASYTGARWVFHHYGPWAQEVHARIEPALDAIHASRMVLQSSRFDDDFVRWRLTDDELYDKLEGELPHSVVSAVRRAVKKYGKDTRELLNDVYATRPMRSAAPGAELVLAVAEPTRGASTTQSSPPSLTARQERKRRERLGKAKEDIKAKLAARRSARNLRTPAAQEPRYDDVYEKGLRWLDELAGADGAEVKGEAEFDDSVWDSETRGDDRE